MNWTEKDVKLFKEKGIEINQVEEQIKNFKNGFPFIQLARAAKAENGIKVFSQNEISKYKQKYENAGNLTKIKFVPASGAATRMFKALFEFETTFKMSGNSALLKNPVYQHVKEFFENLSKFAFYNELKNLLKKGGQDIDKLLRDRNYDEILDVLLDPDGLNYRNLPKGLIHFHSYPDQVRASVEEHLVEGAMYSQNENGEVKIHLTVSPEHKALFEKLINKVKGKYEKDLKVNFTISYSIQKPSTDAIAVDKENNPFREKNGSLHFRPAGHGALLDNLNDLDEDIIFIKNIDNVVPDRLKDDTVLYKKALAGFMLEYRERIYKSINILTNKPNDDQIREIRKFISEELSISNKKAGNDIAVKELIKKLDRPIRVCGMVKNIGEPGGGPFWTKNGDGTISLQIVESSQVDPKDIEQQAMFTSATHFNPVDVVCCIKNYKGKKYNLHDFVDKKTGFITKKSKDGMSLKAMELPGLWNGAMSDWNTFFVEVPITTFNPVKTINDLLRPEHQG